MEISTLYCFGVSANNSLVACQDHFRPELSYVEVKQWLTLPTSSLLLVLTIGVLWLHAAIGIQVVLEDYVSSHRLQKQLVNLVRWIAVLMTACSVCSIIFMWTQ